MDYKKMWYELKEFLITKDYEEIWIGDLTHKMSEIEIQEHKKSIELDKI